MPEEDEKEKKFREEWEKLIAEQSEKSVEALAAALGIDRALNVFCKYIENGELSPEMPLIEAMKKLEEKMSKLVGIDLDDGNSGKPE